MDVGEEGGTSTGRGPESKINSIQFNVVIYVCYSEGRNLERVQAPHGAGGTVLPVAKDGGCSSQARVLICNKVMHEVHLCPASLSPSSLSSFL